MTNHVTGSDEPRAFQRVCIALRNPIFAIALAAAGMMVLGACAASDETGSLESLKVGAIPDQDPERLQRTYGLVADHLAASLEVPVTYVPVTDYAAAVSAFATGDLDLVWFGGLTGVQARLAVDGARAIAQRDIDAAFHSVFIARTDRGIEDVSNPADLATLKGNTFTFGSESSTSGRLMPQHFLAEAGIGLDDFAGEPGFSGGHDATIQLVEAGSYAAGVLNEQVWLSRVEEGAVDTDLVRVIWRTPPYADYHWVARPDLDERFGADFTDQIQATLLALDPNVPADNEILELFGAESFIETNNETYAAIEAVGREIGKIQD